MSTATATLLSDVLTPEDIVRGVTHLPSAPKVLPRLKRPPSFRAFVGEGRASGPPPVQTPEQMEAVLDHWAHLMKAAEVQRQTLGGA